VTRRIMSMKNSNDIIGNLSRNLPVCSAVPQPLRHHVPLYVHIMAVILLAENINIMKHNTMKMKFATQL
jgi:hypothetical protein